MNVASSWETDCLRSIDELLKEALALQPRQRCGWLASLGEKHAAVLPMLRRMLERQASDDVFMKAPVSADVAMKAISPDSDKAGDSVGDYRLVNLLGRGGMATVWLAEHATDPVRASVALKLPNGSWPRRLAERIGRECETLATLHHPGIVRVWEAGATGDGRVFIAMELVEGVPIDKHCADGALTFRDRILLFLRVAEAVSFAHSRLVAHLDLKPANILVDRSGQPRIVDFGIAKGSYMPYCGGGGGCIATTCTKGGDQNVGAAGTSEQALALTPDYACPEQLRGEPVSTAFDVYALGLVLYGLLAGRRPYHLDLGTQQLSVAIKAIRIRPASEVAQDPEDAAHLFGDLDRILAKACHTSASDRYRSVEAMTSDLDEYLQMGSP